MATILVLYVVVIILLLLYLYAFAKERPEGFPPGPPRLPIWGSYWFLLKEHYHHPHVAAEILAKRYKTDILGLYLGDTPCIVPTSQKMVKAALNHEAFIGRNDTIISRMRGFNAPRGILLIDGPYWKDQRRFSLRHMRDFGFGRRSDKLEDFITEETKFMIDLLTCDPKPENMDIMPKKGVALVPDLLAGSVFNIFWTIMGSITFDHQEARKVVRNSLWFLQSGDATGGALTMTPWLKKLAPKFFGYNNAKEAHESLLYFVKDIVDEHIKTFSDDYHRDFIDVFISEQKHLEEKGNNLGFNYEQLLLVVLDYMIPAGVAITQTMNFFFSHLANNPEIQTKIQQEIDQVVGKNNFPTLDDRQLMPYTGASIRENLRISPVNPMGVPRRCMEDTIFEGYFIPKDTIILPSAYSAHKDESAFGEETDKFKPERFLNKRGELLKKDLNVGFGGGKRVCLGESYVRNILFIFTTGFLQNFTVKSLDGKQICLDDPSPGNTVSIENNFMEFVCR